MFHPKHVERLAGNNKIPYKNVILLELYLEMRAEVTTVITTNSKYNFNE
jgi:hypothetical protein